MASSFADDSRAGGRLDPAREVDRVDPGDLRELRLVGRLRVRPEVAGVGSRVEKRRTIGEDHRLGVVADSCLGADVVVRQKPVVKCTLVVVEELPGRPDRRHIRLTWLEECGPHWKEEHSPLDLGKKFDLGPGWIGWCRSALRSFELRERWPVESEHWSGSTWSEDRAVDLA